MEWWIYLIIAIAAVAVLALLTIGPFFLIAGYIYRDLLIRTNKDKWARECSWDDEEQKEMFRIGIEWGEKNEKYHASLSVTSEGFRLAGEYFDFGHKKAVIIIPGRMETCAYSYFFARPYEEMGYNVLAIDNRSHGLSEGKYNTVGIREHKDIIAWAKLLKQEHGIQNVIVHGICIGGATATYAATDDEGKQYFDALITEGMYNDFQIMLNDRFRARKKPIFPFVPIMLRRLKRIAGADAVKFSPYTQINRLEAPILFLYSTKDVFSAPANVQKLYDRCQAPKQIKWFDKGVHSHIRINNQQEYDNVIKEFIKDFA